MNLYKTDTIENKTPELVLKKRSQNDPKPTTYNSDQTPHKDLPIPTWLWNGTPPP